MRESIGGVQIFIIVVIMLLLFSGIMAFTINYSNAFAVKDELVTIVEKAGGLDINTSLSPGSSYEDYLDSDNIDKQTIAKIAESLDNNSYRSSGYCPDSNGSDYVVEAYQRDGNLASSNSKAAFCIAKVKTTSGKGLTEAYYYQIIVFYTLDIPVVNNILNFKAIGETKRLYR